MRTLFFALLMLVVQGVATGGTITRVFLPDLLPANTIACVVPPDNTVLDKEYAGSIFQRIADIPEMSQFLRSFEESRRQFANDISQTANISPTIAYDIIQSKLGIALINIGLGRDGKPQAEFAIAISLHTQPDRATVFSAVMALLNRPEVVRTVLESQGLDPNLPLKTLAQEETISGYPPILRIGPNVRVAAIGNMILLYHGPGSEGIKKIFDALSNPATALSQNASFQAAYRGADASPGTSFIYVNTPRLLSILDALNLGQVTRVADAMGLTSVQSIGLSGGYHGDGVRHTLYLYTPGGNTSGLMSSLIPMPPDAPVGMEGFSRIIPSEADAFMSLRVDISTFLRELPYFLDSLGAVTRPGGMSGMIANERILGVPVAEIVNTLGGDIVIRPHDDTIVLMFHNVNIPAFEGAIGRMEQNASARFNSLNIGGYTVRYFNRRASLTAPLAPAFCLVPHAAGSNQGILYMASHPQAVVSLIQESAAAREPLSNTPDFQKTASGMSGAYSMYYYNGNTQAYRHVYNFLLPVAALWSSSSRYPVDTGLLPPASAITPAFFGCSFGVKCMPEGMKVQAFSPVGVNAAFVLLADKLVVSNPLIIGYTYAMMETWIQAVPTW